MKVLITSGGCKAPIDEVRHIGNFSSGRYGCEIARSFIAEENQVFFLREKGSQALNYDSYLNTRHSRTVEYTDYNDYVAKVKRYTREFKPDVIISAAAISDYIPKKVAGKISSTEDEITITLVKTQKVLKLFRDLAPDALIVGFKLLVSPTLPEISEAVKKVFNNGADIVIYNDLIKLREGDQTRYNFHKYSGNAHSHDDHYYQLGTDSGIIRDAKSLVGHITEIQSLKGIKKLFQ